MKIENSDPLDNLFVKAFFYFFLLPLNLFAFPIKLVAKQLLRRHLSDLLEYNIKQAKKLRAIALTGIVLLFLPAYGGGMIMMNFFFDRKKFIETIFESGMDKIIFFLILCSAIVIYAIAKSVYAALNTPDYDMKVSGMEAETKVSNYLKSSFRPQNGWQVFNDCLFVFNRDQPNEWSAEVDHIVVGGRAIFLVETKYKSGTIHADPDAGQWIVNRFDRNTTMRNALKQSQNSARALGRQLGISGANFVPIVAFVGTDVRVVGGPSNVVHYAESANVIISIDNTIEHRGMSHDLAVQTIERSCLKDSDSMKRHILRAKSKAMESERKNIFDNAVF